MKSTNFIEVLVDLGLSENEAKVYFASLSLGPCSILKIARSAELKRTTVYAVVETLKIKGLMRIEVKGLKKQFFVEPPEKLEHILEERGRKFQNILPQFAALYNLKGNESFIKYYEGISGVKSVYERLLRDAETHDDYLVIGAQEQWFNLDKEYFQSFIERRARRDINIRLLFQDSKTAREHKKYEKNYNEQVKILPIGTSLTTNMIIIPKRVVVHQLTSPILAIEIENKSVVQMNREMFEIIWGSIPE